MNGITSVGGFNNRLEQAKSQMQQILDGQISKETREIADVDRFTQSCSENLPAVAESSAGDESRFEILRHKLLLGCELNAEDLKYLKDKSPDLYDEYMVAENARKQEEKAFQRALRSCSTREDLDRLKNMSINRCIARADRISKNRDLSVEQKAIRIGAERRKLNDINRSYKEFKRSSRYAYMPSEKKLTSRNYSVSRFYALQNYAEIAAMDAKERLEQLSKELGVSSQKDR